MHRTETANILIDSNNSQQNCKHCGLPLVQNQVVDYNSNEFCCHGCETVYQIIHSNNLEYFYKLRADEKLNPINNISASFDFYDDPIFYSQHVQIVNNSQHVVSFYVERIHCSACIWLLEKLPEFIRGLLSLRANLGNSTIKLEFNPKLATLSAIAKQISSFGYKPVELTEQAQKQSRLRYERDFLLRLGVAGFCAGNTMLLAISLYQGDYTGMESKYQLLLQYVSALFAIPAVFYSSMPFYRSAWASLKVRQLHIDTPISLGIVVGFFGGLYSLFTSGSAIYFDSICILIFLLLAGRWIQYRMLERANAKLTLNSFLPKSALLLKDNQESEVLLDRLLVGDKILVRSNQVVPVDARLLSSSANVDNSHITGESRSVSLSAGDLVYAGAINKSQAIELLVSAVGEQSRIGKVLKSVSDNLQTRPMYYDFTSKLSYWFTIVVVSLSILTLYFNWHLGFDQALSRMIALLVITCPCALGLSAPLAATVAVSKAYRQGILIRSSQVFEKLAKIKYAFFDKTGTLTKGVGRVLALYHNSEQVTDAKQFSELLQVAYALEKNIEHPVAFAIRDYCKRNLEDTNQSVEFRNINFVQSSGVEAITTKGCKVMLGKVEWVLASDKSSKELEEVIHQLRARALSTVLLRVDQSLLVFAIGDEVLSETREVLITLKSRGINSAVISGDSNEVVNALANDLTSELDFAKGDLNPEDKACLVATKEQSQRVMVVGDGINDVLAMSKASLAVAIRGGVEACLNTAEVFISSGKIESIKELILAGEQTRKVIMRNILISLFYNIIGGYGAITGLVNPLVAAILMPLSSISIIYSSFKNNVFKKIDE